jgi:flagellar basal body P-ring formation protein FlgA
MLWTSGSLRMEMQGRAEESGALGDEIRVLNTQSGHTIRGVVTGDSMTEVRSTP